MRFIPDHIAGKSPRGPYPDKEIPFGLLQHIADKEEQQADHRQHGCAHFEIVVAEAPCQGQRVDVEHEGHKEHDKKVESFAEFRNICF